MEDKVFFLLFGYYNGIDKFGSRNMSYVFLYKEED